MVRHCPFPLSFPYFSGYIHNTPAPFGIAIKARGSKMERATDLEDSVFLELLNTAVNPSSVDAIPSDQLAASLGIDGPLSREQALELLENGVLAPAHKFQGHELGYWQV